MSGEAAIDANLYIAITKREIAAMSRLGSFQKIHLPTVVLGELLFGAGASGRPAENRRKVEAFAARCAALPVTRDAAERYADLRLQLRAIGRPIPDNDLWIAATCLAAGLPLITRDGHFAHVAGLNVITW